MLQPTMLPLATQRRQHFEALVGHHKQLEVWAEHNPVTFENRAAIVGAEIARIEGRVLEAQDLYEKAVRSAHTHGFVHNEAIANERAGCFYAARGFEKIATTYLRDARYCYLRWGADGKGSTTRAALSAAQSGQADLGSDSHDTDTRRAPRSGDRDQGLRSGVG